MQKFWVSIALNWNADRLMSIRMFQSSRVLNSGVKHVVKVVRFKKDVAIIGAPFSGGQVSLLHFTFFNLD